MFGIKSWTVLIYSVIVIVTYSHSYLVIHFGVIDDVDENTVFEAIDDGQKKFGFTAADWFDVICMALRNHEK